MQFKKDQEKDNALMQQQMNFAQKSAEDAVVRPQKETIIYLIDRENTSKWTISHQNGPSCAEGPKGS